MFLETCATNSTWPLQRGQRSLPAAQPPALERFEDLEGSLTALQTISVAIQLDASKNQLLARFLLPLTVAGHCLASCHFWFTLSNPLASASFPDPAPSKETTSLIDFMGSRPH